MGDSFAKWPKSLESRLGKLSDSSSRESFQTVARWIIFHRKHIGAFVIPIRAGLATARGTIVCSVLNALFLAYKSKTGKWDDLADLRVQIAEQCLLDSQSVIAAPVVAALKTHLDEWEKSSCFPELVEKLRRKLNNKLDSSSGDVDPSAVEAADKKIASPAAARTSASTNEVAPFRDDEPILPDDDFPMEDNPPDSPPHEPEAEKPQIDDDSNKRKISFGDDDKPGWVKRSRPSVPGISDLKFEDLDIPARVVDPSELVDASTAIATVQIDRDLQADFVLRLSTLLQELPEKVRARIVEVSETGIATLDDEEADELSRLVSDELLDLDVKQQLATVRLYRTLVERQNTARLSAIRLLQESRCKFGSVEAAEAYYTLTEVKHYDDQSQQLVDMLDLEGLDLETVLAKEKKLDKDDKAFAGALPSITWYEELIKDKDGTGC